VKGRSRRRATWAKKRFTASPVLRPRVRKIFSAVFRWVRFTRARKREEASMTQICSKVSTLQDPKSRLRGRIRIKTIYWGYRLKGEVFVNVNVKVNGVWWNVKGGK
jgi:hypothetical protein